MEDAAHSSEAVVRNHAKALNHTPKVIAPNSYEDLEKYLTNLGYRWDTLDKGVPPIVLEAMPADMNRIEVVAKKKKLFFLSLLPMALMANAEVEQERQQILAIFTRYDKGQPLSQDQRALLSSISKKYKVAGDPLAVKNRREQLLMRVDTIPTALVLAQGATESAYGSSRFAREGNNLFGEWTFTPGSGLVPEGRPEGETYEVRRFANLLDSVRSYVKNLNTHRAYRILREKRAELRQNNLPVTALDLAEGLLLYSTRKEAYVEDVKAIINTNRLYRVAGCRLSPKVTPPAQGSDEIAVVQTAVKSIGDAVRRLNP